MLCSVWTLVFTLLWMLLYIDGPQMLTLLLLLIWLPSSQNVSWQTDGGEPSWQWTSTMKNRAALQCLDQITAQFGIAEMRRTFLLIEEEAHEQITGRGHWMSPALIGPFKYLFIWRPHSLTQVWRTLELCCFCHEGGWERVSWAGSHALFNGTEVWVNMSLWTTRWRGVDGWTRTEVGAPGAAAADRPRPSKGGTR